jgi:hypothetical protein
MSKSSKTQNFIVVDPWRQHLALIGLNSASFVGDFRRLLKTMKVGGRKIMHIDGQPLAAYAAVDLDQVKDIPAFRFPNQTELSTTGKAILVGLGDGEQTVKSCPATLEWVRDNIIWLTSIEAADSDAGPAVPL